MEWGGGSWEIAPGARSIAESGPGKDRIKIVYSYMHGKIESTCSERRPGDVLVRGVRHASLGLLGTVCVTNTISYLTLDLIVYILTYA